MESLPGYIPIVFILTTLATFGFLVWAVKGVGFEKLQARLPLFLIPLWGNLTAILAVKGFYQHTTSVPPRLVLFAVFPAVLLIIIYFIFFRSSFIERLPLRRLTLLHIVRIPVELVLLWLSFGGQVPQEMTFEGRNLDILSGISGLIVYFVAFRGGTVDRPILIGYNILGLLLLANIVFTAVLALPSPMQQIAFDHPNRAVLYFPYVWLPAIVVPIVLFSHLAALWKLLFARDR